jgi:hypothetical protein
MPDETISHSTEGRNTATREALDITTDTLAETNAALQMALTELERTTEECRTLGIEVYVLSEQLKASEAELRAMRRSQDETRPSFAS